MENALRMANWNTNKPLCVGLEIEELQLELRRLNEGSLFLSYPLTEKKARREIKGKIKRRQQWLEQYDAQQASRKPMKPLANYDYAEIDKQVLSTLAHFNKSNHKS